MRYDDSNRGGASMRHRFSSLPNALNHTSNQSILRTLKMYYKALFLKQKELEKFFKNLCFKCDLVKNTCDEVLNLVKLYVDSVKHL